ncbi:hypothetical protein [Pseudanabaena galeata]|nr:hypothetical protein [Pseudanabaena galeata]
MGKSQLLIVATYQKLCQKIFAGSLVSVAIASFYFPNSNYGSTDLEKFVILVDRNSNN